MRRAIFLTAALLCAPAAGAGVHQVTLKVGKPVPFTPGALPTQIVCDDLSVLRVQDAGDHLRLTGLKPGSTECSFGMLSTPGLRQIYRFDVVR
jgi:hypothetical protein